MKQRLRRGHLADLEVVEAILLSDPRERASNYDAEPKSMAEAVRNIIDHFDLSRYDQAEADAVMEALTRVVAAHDDPGHDSPHQREVLDAMARVDHAVASARDLLSSEEVQLRVEGKLMKNAMMAQEIAREFHESYERLAPEHGYETRPESAKPWEDVPEQNKGLMSAVVEDLLTRGVIGVGAQYGV